MRLGLVAMRIDISDGTLLLVVVLAVCLWLGISRRRKQTSARQAILREAMAKWWTDADRRCTDYRELVTAIEKGDRPTCTAALGRVDLVIDLVDLHPVVRRALLSSSDVGAALTEMLDNEQRFLAAARACENRLGVGALYTYAGYKDLKLFHHKTASAYLSLREKLEEWITDQ